MINTNNFSPINFKAKFIEQVDIKKYDPKSGLYAPSKLSFVEFDYLNEQDVQAIDEAVQTWKGQAYADIIARAAMLMSEGIMPTYNNHIYMATSQMQNFDKLDKNKILGLAQMRDGDSYIDYLRYFQVKPDLKYGTKNREYKHIGSAMIDSIKKIYNETIVLISSLSATGFYEKQGFKLLDLDLLKYIWCPKMKM